MLIKKTPFLDTLCNVYIDVGHKIVKLKHAIVTFAHGVVIYSYEQESEIFEISNYYSMNKF